MYQHDYFLLTTAKNRADELRRFGQAHRRRAEARRGWRARTALMLLSLAKRLEPGVVTGKPVAQT